MGTVRTRRERVARGRSGRQGRPAAALLLLGLLAIALSSTDGWASATMGPTSASPGVVTAEPAAAPHLRPDDRVSLVWLFGGSSADYRRQVERMVGVSVVSPVWWELSTDQPGALDLGSDPDFVAWAQARGLAVWPLVTNRFDPDLTEQVLGDATLRRQVVTGIAQEVRRIGADGVNVDFENLHDRTRFLLTDMVAELQAELPDLVVSVDVTAMTDTWVLDNWSTALDREGLGQVADYVALMAYDQHNSLRRDGPVAGLTWVEESVEFLLRTVPADKVLLGLPLYSRDWAEDPEARDGIALDATLGMAAMARRLAERSESVTFDPVAGQDLHTYVDARGRTHRVWHEDVDSLLRKTDLVGRHGLAGIAAWRAGFEPAEVWPALDERLTNLPPPPPAEIAQATPGPAVTPTTPGSTDPGGATAATTPRDQPDGPAESLDADPPATDPADPAGVAGQPGDPRPVERGAALGFLPRGQDGARTLAILLAALLLAVVAGGLWVSTRRG